MQLGNFNYLKNDKIVVVMHNLMFTLLYSDIELPATSTYTIILHKLYKLNTSTLADREKCFICNKLLLSINYESMYN